MARKVRVGIAVTGGSRWLGGVIFVELLIKALAHLPQEERPELQLIVNDYALLEYDLFRPCAELADGVIFIGLNGEGARRIIGEHFTWVQTNQELFENIDLYFPVNSGVVPGRSAISWIPDFQHCYLPEFFSPEERARRDARFSEIASKAKMLVLSSRAVEDDFWALYPDSKTRTMVLTYSLLPEDSWYSHNPVDVQLKYKLPEYFVLCCNQFWIHKNHKVLFEAVANLRKEGRDVHVVCTGKTEDYRWTDYFSQLTEYIKKLEIPDLIHILGLVSREDQIQLIRRCVCVVQPSLFEGLSLIVCEARALGKTIIVSDIPVHREQKYGIYFNPQNAEALATVLQNTLTFCSPGPDRERECAAHQDAQQAVIAFAKGFCRVIKTAVAVFKVDIINHS